MKKAILLIILIVLLIFVLLIYLGDLRPKSKDYILTNKEYKKVLKMANDKNITAIQKLRNHFLFIGNMKSYEYWMLKEMKSKKKQKGDGP